MRILLLTCVLLFPLTVVAQETPAGEVAGGYQHVVAFAGGESEQIPGWFISGSGYVTDSLAIIGMVTGGYTSVGIYDELSSSVYQFMGGVHETYLRDNDVSPFVRTLFGLERSAVGIAGVSASDSAFVISSGAGVDIRMAPQTAFRVAGDYRRAFGYEGGGGTNDLTFTVGLVVGFGSR